VGEGAAVGVHDIPEALCSWNSGGVQSMWQMYFVLHLFIFILLRIPSESHRMLTRPSSNNRNYEQIGLKFKLFSAEVLFNKGLSLIYMGNL